MNINEPANSRILAQLIQGVPGDERMRFIEDARAAKDIESFTKQFMINNAKKTQK
jgi:hypothetical protein